MAEIGKLQASSADIKLGTKTDQVPSFTKSATIKKVSEANTPAS